MGGVHKTLIILILGLLELVVGLKGCRQCHGKQYITFTEPVSQYEATQFLRYSLGQCATGKNYNIVKATKDGNTWTFDLQIWRYCGNGGSNYVDKGGSSFSGLTSVSDKRALICTKSVECGRECLCSLCGC